MTHPDGKTATVEYGEDGEPNRINLPDKGHWEKKDDGTWRRYDADNVVVDTLHGTIQVSDKGDIVMTDEKKGEMEISYLKEYLLDREIGKLPEEKQQQIRDLINPVDGEDIDSRESRVSEALKEQPQLIKPYIDFEEARFAKEAHEIGTMRDIALDLKSMNRDIERADEIKKVVNDRAYQFSADLQNESIHIAALMDRNDADAAMKALTKDLKQLNDVHFNELLLNIYDNDTKGEGLDLDIGKFIRKTGTFSYARVDHSALHTEHPNPYVIVQGGDSVSRIANEWLNTPHNNSDLARYTQEIAKANGLRNPNAIAPGQALRLPFTSMHKFPVAGD